MDRIEGNYLKKDHRGGGRESRKEVEKAGLIDVGESQKGIKKRKSDESWARRSLKSRRGGRS